MSKGPCDSVERLRPTAPPGCAPRGIGCHVHGAAPRVATLLLGQILRGMCVEMELFFGERTLLFCQPLLKLQGNMLACLLLAKPLFQATPMQNEYLQAKRGRSDFPSPVPSSAFVYQRRQTQLVSSTNYGSSSHTSIEYVCHLDIILARTVSQVGVSFLVGYSLRVSFEATATPWRLPYSTICGGHHGACATKNKHSRENQSDKPNPRVLCMALCLTYPWYRWSSIWPMLSHLSNNCLSQAS